VLLLHGKDAPHQLAPLLRCFDLVGDADQPTAELEQDRLVARTLEPRGDQSSAR
jgi:hypothetical protein